MLNIENAEEGAAKVRTKQGRHGISRLPDFLRFDLSRSQRKRFWKRKNEFGKMHYREDRGPAPEDVFAWLQLEQNDMNACTS